MTHKLNKIIICSDGFEISVQANENAYCTPRINNADRYTEVECGFPSCSEPLLIEYAEEPNSPTETVYAWVPSMVITNVIAKHGGIVSGEVPPGVAFLKAPKNVNMQV
jgi:hypothetical protein